VTRSRCVAAVLETLSLEKPRTSPRSFEELFLRFQRRVACETLTRAPRDAGLLDAEAFFAEWVDEETGLVGEERARAFTWLAESCGFETAILEGSCRRPWEGEASARDVLRLGEGPGGFSLKENGSAAVAHAGVIATIAGRRILADAGFPLPVLLPLDPPTAASAFPTGMGELSVSIDERGRITVTCDARGEVTEMLNVGPAPSPSPLPFKDISRASPENSPSPETPGVFALRVLDDRVLFWRAGRMTILDAWSRLEYPLPSSSRAALEKLFALELQGVALRDEPHVEADEPATLSVFHLSPAAPEVARGRLGRDAAPLRLVSGRQEFVEPVADGSRITIRATLSAVPPEGPGEAVRKALVFHLVSEIFALARDGGERG
jgi:hypothetical protein